MTHEEVCGHYGVKCNETVDALIACVVKCSIEPWLAYAALISVARTIKSNHPDVEAEMKRMSSYFETGEYPSDSSIAH
jgi:hypothetical protein